VAREQQFDQWIEEEGVEPGYLPLAWAIFFGSGKTPGAPQNRRGRSDHTAENHTPAGAAPAPGTLQHALSLHRSSICAFLIGQVSAFTSAPGLTYRSQFILTGLHDVGAISISQCFDLASSCCRDLGDNASTHRRQRSCCIRFDAFHTGSSSTACSDVTARPVLQ
jgi:hypothetical protein